MKAGWRPAVKDDALIVGTFMRQQDVKECRVLAGLDPVTALRAGLTGRCYTAYDEDGTPFLMFGITPQQPGVGVAWMLFTEDVKPHLIRRVLSETPAVWSEISEGFDYCYNFLPADQSHMLRWLKRIGFNAVKRYWFDGEPHHLIEWRKPCAHRQSQRR